MQGMPGRPPLPLQVDTTNDSGSMTKVNTPRMGSDGNPSGDMEGGEGDDVSNHNMHSRHLPRMSSTSPSADSQQRKAATNMVKDFLFSLAFQSFQSILMHRLHHLLLLKLNFHYAFWAGFNSY